MTNQDELRLQRMNCPADMNCGAAAQLFCHPERKRRILKDPSSLSTSLQRKIARYPRVPSFLRMTDQDELRLQRMNCPADMNSRTRRFFGGRAMPVPTAYAFPLMGKVPKRERGG